ncbi:hypothetical protein BCR34DRAFT_601323 [Clohesyomyces aquaticus]|uniref:DUF7580 domain-containing protein n=1 Tax=Clohesyomyces aquaticus TaxID=1231657 RepID=A0A1Y1ZMR0_9PLEO|nr:hypothetical protein BCR34DRAFT_601323 [Clohesyomyces aquaticus]
MFQDLAQILKQNLQSASDSLSGAEERRPRRFQRLRKKVSSEPLRYSFVYESIEVSIKKLESWLTRFDSAFFLLTRIGGIDLDPQLGEEDPAPGQPARRLRRLRKAVGGYDPGEILKQSDASTFGLLSCLGIFYQPPSSATAHQPKFNMLFTFADDLSSPVPLPSLLRRKDSEFSVNERLKLAIELAKSLMLVHHSKFVHKNIRPETVIVSQTKSRSWARDARLEKHVYRPPSRQGLNPETDYTMQHDIYSLGVVLLEIGLWTSFVEYDKEKKPWLLQFISTKEILADRQEKRRALALKARLIEATGYLPS